MSPRCSGWTYARNGHARLCRASWPTLCLPGAGLALSLFHDPLRFHWEHISVQTLPVTVTGTSVKQIPSHGAQGTVTPITGISGPSFASLHLLHSTDSPGQFSDVGLIVSDSPSHLGMCSAPILVYVPCCAMSSMIMFASSSSFPQSPVHLSTCRHL
jgi:hypothetical protein